MLPLVAPLNINWLCRQLCAWWCAAKGEEAVAGGVEEGGGGEGEVMGGHARLQRERTGVVW